MGFFTMYGHGCQVGHVTSIMLINFHLLEPIRLHTKFGGKCLGGFEKSKFLISYVHDLGLRSRNDIDLQYSNT